MFKHTTSPNKLVESCVFESLLLHKKFNLFLIDVCKTKPISFIFYSFRLSLIKKNFNNVEL